MHIEHSTVERGASKSTHSIPVQVQKISSLRESDRKLTKPHR